MGSVRWKNKVQSLPAFAVLSIFKIRENTYRRSGFKCFSTMFIKASTGLCLPNVCIKNKELIAKKPRVRGLGINTEPLKKRVQTETTETAFKVKVFSLLKHKKM